MLALAEESKVNRIINPVSLTYHINLPCMHQSQLKSIRNQTNNTFPIIKLVVAIFLSTSNVENYEVRLGYV